MSNNYLPKNKIIGGRKMAELWFVKERKKRRIVEYYVYKNSTVRETADHFGVSKSYVHRVIKEFQVKYANTDKFLISRLQTQVANNIAERSSRGGRKVKQKHLSSKK